MNHHGYLLSQYVCWVVDKNSATYMWTNLCLCHLPFQSNILPLVFCEMSRCIPSFLHLIVFFILIFVGVAFSFLPFKYPHLILMSLQRSSARPRYKMESSTSMVSLFLSTDFMFILTHQSLCVYNICRCTIQILIWKEMYVWTFCVKIGSLFSTSTLLFMAWIFFLRYFIFIDTPIDFNKSILEKREDEKVTFVNCNSCVHCCYHVTSFHSLTFLVGELTFSKVIITSVVARRLSSNEHTNLSET